ncbi:MAG: hypothetical protein ACP5LE_04620, partial [Thermoplasmata archaeon]
VVYVKDLDSGEAIENASVEVNVSGVKIASKVTEKDGRAVFEFVLDNRETESLEIMINANKNGYENASTFLRLGLSREERSADVAIEIATLVLVSAIIICVVYWVKKRKRARRVY